MSHSSQPPKGPLENLGIPRIHPHREVTDEPVVARRREDVHGEIDNVITLRAGIRMRRSRDAKSKENLRKGKSLRKAVPRIDGLTPLDGPTITSIAGGKRTEEKVAAIEHRAQAAMRRGQLKLYEVALTMDLEGIEEILPQNIADELIRLSDLAEFHEPGIRPDDPLLFQKVARVLLTLWPNNYSIRLNDKRVTMIVTELQEPEIMKKRLLAILYGFEKQPV